MERRDTAGTIRAISDLPTLPVFFKLKGRNAVLAGGSLPAVWKAELLAAAGALVLVFDPAPCPEMIGLAAQLPDSLRLNERRWNEADLAGAALAIGALEGENAMAFRQAAIDAGVPVNIVDVPNLCDFQFGTIVDHGPLLIAISTDGAAPVFGQRLRTRIEALLPPGIEAWAQAAKDWRPALQALNLSFAARRRFWEEFADRALSSAGSPHDRDRQDCLEAASGEGERSRGSVDLVGLGPGGPDQLTLEAVRSLQAADVIIHGIDLDPSLLRTARREARRVQECRNEGETAALIREMTGSGTRVVWAALGDPLSCHRWYARRSSLTVTPRSVVAGICCRTCSIDCAKPTSDNQ